MDCWVKVLLHHSNKNLQVYFILKRPHVPLHLDISPFNFSLLLVSNFKAIIWRRTLFVVVQHFNHTFVFHLAEALLRKMKISSWQWISALFLLQAMLFSRFTPLPHLKSGSVWKGEEQREGGSEFSSHLNPPAPCEAPSCLPDYLKNNL